MEQNHCCHTCNAAFPKGTSTRRKYCSNACKMKAQRSRNRVASKTASAHDQIVLQNEELRAQLTRTRAELAKVHNRANRHRAESKAARNDLKRFTAERQRSLLYFQSQHQELRAKYRQAHTLITALGHQLHAISTDQAAWTELTTAPASQQRGPLPSDNDNVAALLDLVASVSRQLDDTFGLRHQRPRTLHDNATVSDSPDATGAAASTTNPTVADASAADDDTIQRQRETIAKADNIINTLSERLTIAKTAHSKLREQYTRSQQALAAATSQREQNRIIITQWRVLARELYRRTGGRPTEQRHRDILATLSRYEAWTTKGQNK